MITVTLPVITLMNSDTGTDPYLVDLPGWDDSAAVKRDKVRRNTGHGVFGQSPVYDDAKYFEIVGRIIHPGGAAQIRALRTTLMGLKRLAPGWPVTVADSTDGSVRTAYVEFNGKLEFYVADENAVADFTIPLAMKDPRTYGPVEVLSTGLPSGGGGITFPLQFPLDFGAPGVPGRVVTTNAGEAETYSIIEVTGGLSEGFSAVCRELGQEIRFERQIPLGSTVSVDLRTGQAFIDGQSPVSGSLTRRDWWTNPPGATRTIQLNGLGTATGTPTLTAYTAPAFN
jgi:hypothetical protein